MLLAILTVIEMMQTFSALVAAGGKSEDAQVNKIKSTLILWQKRKPFSLDEVDVPATPSVTKKPRQTPTPEASPSARGLLPDQE